MGLNRRQLLKMAMAASASPWALNFQAMAAPFTKIVKITDVKTMGLDNLGDGSILKIETDAGLVGYGESGSSAQMARANVEQMKPFLIGQDPLAIEQHFYRLSTTQYPYRAHVPTVGGVDIALWDLAGKIIGLPVYRLLGGPIRTEIPVYSHGSVRDMLDKAQCRAWADQAKAAPEGFTAYKFTGLANPPASASQAQVAGQAINGPAVGTTLAGAFRREGKGGFPYSVTLDGGDFRRIGKGYENLREAVGVDLDIALHCLAQYDTRSAIGLCKAIEPADPLWIEDPLNARYSEAWLELKRSTRVPVLTGERLELVEGFRGFLDNQVVDVIHPDMSCAGGITACKRIANYAALTRTPVAFHSGPSSLIKFYASMHVSAAIQNLFKVENVLGAFRGYKEQMAQGTKPVIRNGVFKMTEAPGLGLEINEDWLRLHMEKGDSWWG